MKKKYLALSAGMIFAAAVLAVQIPGLVSAETQERMQRLSRRKR